MPRSKSIVFGTAAGAIALAAVFFFMDRARDPASSTEGQSTAFVRSEPQGEESSVPSGATLDSPPASASTPDPASASPQLDAAAQAQVRVLNEILSSRNDNDPRLDRELKTLPPSARSAFRTRYQALPKEDRNGRGTILFLLGRNLETLEDLSFLEAVLAEAPCFSLNDCSKDTRAANGEEAHYDSTIEVTLAYPQLVALASLERFLQSDSGRKDSPERSKALRALETASHSPIPRVSKKASEILHSIRNSGTA